MIVSISGPSKSGKTVLVTKVVAPENLIHIYGASIKTPEDLWSNVLTWMGGPIERTETAGSKIAGELTASAGGKGGIPFLAEAKGSLAGGVSADSTTSTTKKFSTIGLDAIVREIGDSDYVIFVDDLHYIERTVREEIGRQIKAAAEKGIRICTASVPHRSDDVVRSNPELRGRVTAIDMSYWTLDEPVVAPFLFVRSAPDRTATLFACVCSRCEQSIPCPALQGPVMARTSGLIGLPKPIDWQLRLARERQTAQISIETGGHPGNVGSNH